MRAPQFVSMTWRPEQGMRMVQAVADLPGIGRTELLADGPFAGALLVPFANRIRGAGLRPNWRGKAPGAEPCAMHGLILERGFDVLEQSAGRVLAELNAGDFDGYWPSQSSIRVQATMSASTIDIVVDVQNVGDEPLPVGIGWHPYFRLPGGRRETARLHVPAHRRVVVNNYDDVFPTGEIDGTAATAYDFTPAGGRPLGTQYYDDCLFDLSRDGEGEASIELHDPEAGYAMRLIARSPEIRAVQVYAPPDQPFVVVEPQFNLPDPFSASWGRDVDTGMVRLPPGERTSWHVSWQLLH